jgi:hypothetical protein
MEASNAARVKVSRETFKWVDIVLRRNTED